LGFDNDLALTFFTSKLQIVKFSLFWQNEDFSNETYKDYVSSPGKVFMEVKGQGAGYRIWAKLVTILTDTTSR
jgi:hypothetical protein